jgi:hypothetical protein
VTSNVAVGPNPLLSHQKVSDSSPWDMWRTAQAKSPLSSTRAPDGLHHPGQGRQLRDLRAPPSPGGSPARGGVGTSLAEPRRAPFIARGRPSPPPGPQSGSEVVPHVLE